MHTALCASDTMGSLATNVYALHGFWQEDGTQGEGSEGGEQS